MSRGVEENYYALCICVLSERIPEEAFRIMEGKPVEFDSNAVEDILRYRKTHTWNQVAERYGTTADAIRRRVVRFQNKEALKRNTVVNLLGRRNSE